MSATSLDAVAEVPERAASAAFSRVLDRQSLEPALARLTPEQRQAIELRFMEGMSVAETAAAMGRSDEAVKKLQARALANLRRHLAPPAPHRPDARGPLGRQRLPDGRRLNLTRARPLPRRPVPDARAATS